MSATNNPFAVQGNPTVVNPEQHGSMPTQNTVGVPQVAPQAAPMPGGLPTGIPGGAQEMTFEVNYDDVQSNRMAVGQFPIVVSDVQPQTSAAGNPMHVFTVQCIDPKHIGKESKIFCAITPQALWKHQETTKAIGLGSGEGPISFTRSQVVGRCAIGVFAEEPDRNNNMRVNCVKLLPHPAGLGITLAQLQSMGNPGNGPR